MLLVLILFVVVVVIFATGAHRSPAECQHCKKQIPGTKQVWFGTENRFCLCKECAGKIPRDFMDYAKQNWTYITYTDYLQWDQETADERAQFEPDIKYGYFCEISIDTKRKLFKFGKQNDISMIFRFKDLIGYDINFKPEEYKEGFLGDKVKGTEYGVFKFARPDVELEVTINPDVKLSAVSRGFIAKRFEYNLSEEFKVLINNFAVCALLSSEEFNKETETESRNIGELEKAMALFMFDNVEEITQESLKNQRNALIKAFHPDNNEANVAFSQKINAAYELLSGVVSR